LRKAVGILTESLTASFDQETQDDEMSFPAIPHSWKATGPGYLTSPGYRLNRKYLPYDYFRSQIIDPGKKYSIAVLPMLDLAGRKNSGIIAQLHYVRELFNLTDFKVIEPGLVREDLLRIRAIMPQGPSLAETDLITGKELLGVDLVLAGKVFDYQNTSTNPKVDISVQIIEKYSRQVVFGARIFNTGLDKVFFYNFGREYTAHNLLKEMAKITVQLLTAPYRIEEQGEEELIAHHPPLKRDEIKATPIRSPINL
jgi:TolB-like protein